MNLAVLDSRDKQGRVISEPTEADVLTTVGESVLYAALAEAPHRYIYCSADEDAPGGFWLGYHDGPTEVWYASEGLVDLDAIVRTFLKSLRGDRSWRLDFQWSKVYDDHA